MVTNPKSNLVLINKHRKLPDGYIPEDLTRPNVPFISPKDKEKTLLRKDAAEALENMFKAAKKKGLILQLYLVIVHTNAKNRCMIHTLDAKEKPKLIR